MDKRIIFIQWSVIIMLIAAFTNCSSTGTQKNTGVSPAEAVILTSEAKVDEKVVAAAVMPVVIVFAFEDIPFDFDKSTLKPEAQTILKRNIQILKNNAKAKIRIAGYTSASGSEKHNQTLSEKRARAVRNYLTGKGLVTPNRLTTIGYGEKNPAMHEVAPKKIYSKAAKANMRVLFEIVVQ